MRNGKRGIALLRATEALARNRENVMLEIVCGHPHGARQRTRRRAAFTLIELLTVIFIIGLLISILIPALGKARDQAKKVSTLKGIDSIKVGMEMFKNDNGSDFTQTNGYPPSFVHPPLTAYPGGFTADDAFAGKYPYTQEKPVIYGAQWLPAMLMGKDSQGFIKRSSAPKTLEPFKWYDPDVVTGKPIERSPMYVTPENAPTKKTNAISGRQPADLATLFPDWARMENMPVFVDGWDQPILYYAANTSGKATNLVEKVHNKDNAYGTGDQRTGPPYYFHADNVGFTGKDGTDGWILGTSEGKHAIQKDGADLTAGDLVKPENKETFAHYIVDRKVYSNLLTQAEQPGGIQANTPLRPVNADSFLLISAGVDGRFGTSDDVSNLPAFDGQ